jgi:tetratricopeptide (TPR) repeat protein
MPTPQTEMYTEGMALGFQFALLLLVAVVVPATAYADKEQAKVHYERGKRLYHLSRFDDAVKAYEAAYLEMEDPAFLFNIGQCYRQLGNNDLALRSYRNYLRSAPDAANRSDVENRIKEIEATLAKDKEPKPAPVAAQPEPTTAVPVVPVPAMQEPAVQVGAASEPAPVDDGTNWLLWGGIGAGVVAVVLVAVLVSSGGTERPGCPEGIQCF